MPMKVANLSAISLYLREPIYFTLQLLNGKYGISWLGRHAGSPKR
jgi:hypothetical protein